MEREKRKRHAEEEDAPDDHDHDGDAGDGESGLKKPKVSKSALPEEVLQLFEEVCTNDGDWNLGMAKIDNVVKHGDNEYEFSFTKTESEGDKEKEVTYKGHAQRFNGAWLVAPHKVSNDDLIRACRAMLKVFKEEILDEIGEEEDEEDGEGEGEGEGEGGEGEGEEEGGDDEGGEGEKGSHAKADKSADKKAGDEYTDPAVKTLSKHGIAVRFGYWPFHWDEEGLSKEAGKLVLTFSNEVSDHGLWCAFSPGAKYPKDEDYYAYIFN